MDKKYPNKCDDCGGLAWLCYFQGAVRLDSEDFGAGPRAAEYCTRGTGRKLDLCYPCAKQRGWATDSDLGQAYMRHGEWWQKRGDFWKDDGWFDIGACGKFPRADGYEAWLANGSPSISYTADEIRQYGARCAMLS